MRVDLIPAFDDNYLFAAVHGRNVMVVDPGSAPEVSDSLVRNGLTLTHILVTHHHGDHIGGVEALVGTTGAKLWGPSSLADYGLKADRVLKDGDRIEFEGFEFDVLAVPGHTLDHLAYLCAREQVLFCGDTLFSLGCGRLFEGTFEQMHASLAKLKALPDTVRVYCAHEYTLTNALFSKSYAEAYRANEVARYRDLHTRIKAERDAKNPTVPSTIGFEKEYNLFLRAPTVDEFKHVRLARNQFRAPPV